MQTLDLRRFSSESRDGILELRSHKSFDQASSRVRVLEGWWMMCPCSEPKQVRPKKRQVKIPNTLESDRHGPEEPGRASGPGQGRGTARTGDQVGQPSGHGQSRSSHQLPITDILARCGIVDKTHYCRLSTNVFLKVKHTHIAPKADTARPQLGPQRVHLRTADRYSFSVGWFAGKPQATLSYHTFGSRTMPTNHPSKWSTLPSFAWALSGAQCERTRRAVSAMRRTSVLLSTASRAIHERGVNVPGYFWVGSSTFVVSERLESEMVYITFKKLYLLADITMQVYRYIRRQEYVNRRKVSNLISLDRIDGTHFTRHPQSIDPTRLPVIDGLV
ncbi:hypothetical protein AG1IA_09395 [Rhizoctonia solani AG-1 IA]|uniref:Uncharacterized protein n=1 Tax=Thanatephorus cucumeris (strain AG1-IA) TaxID=983506 RepID=L8WF24_THACA|nr:hypothetical protein AG1IA_09395 [Rhizoctonia solani AG-1 IA]